MSKKINKPDFDSDRQDASDARQDASDVHDAWTESRIKAVEDAITAINHASTQMARWAGNIDGQLDWIKMLVGATAVAAFGQLVLSLLRGG